MTEEERTVIQVGAAELAAGLKLVEHARASDERRPILTTVLMRTRGDVLLLVAGDNYRLVEVEVRLREPVETDQKGCVPPRALAGLRSLLSTYKTGTVTLDLGDQRFTATIYDSTFSCRLMDGTYPDYQQPIFGERLDAATGRIDFTGEFLADALRTAGKLGATAVRFSDSLAPVYVTAPGYRECIMPVRTAGIDEATQEATRELAHAAA